MSKINHKLDINITDPFDADKFNNRREFADVLSEDLRNIDDLYVISINAPWGQGKTTFAKMWINSPFLKNAKCIYYNAYECDYFEDPFISFVGEIIHLFKNDKKTDKLKEFSIEIMKEILAPTLFNITDKFTYGIISNDSVGFVKRIFNIFKKTKEKNIKDIGKYFEEKINNYKKQKDTIKSFKNELEKISREVKEKTGYPLIIVVDEIDRCRPGFALNLIERIKHFFEIPNVTFVLMTNEEQLFNYIKKVYGEETDAVNYLHKFITKVYNLPVNKNEERTRYFQYLLEIFNKYEGVGYFTNDRIGMVMQLFNSFQLTNREIERYVQILLLYFAKITEKELVGFELIIRLVILKIKFPEYFFKLSQGDDVSEHYQNKKVQSIKVLYSILAWIANLMLDSSARKEELSKIASALAGISKNQIISFYCKRIDKPNFPLL